MGVSDRYEDEIVHRLRALSEPGFAVVASVEKGKYGGLGLLLITVEITPPMPQGRVHAKHCQLYREAVAHWDKVSIVFAMR